MFAPTCFSGYRVPGLSAASTGRLLLVINTGYRPLFFSVETTWFIVYSAGFSIEKFRVRNVLLPFRTYTHRPLIKNPRIQLVDWQLTLYTSQYTHSTTHNHSTQRDTSVQCRMWIFTAKRIVYQTQTYIDLLSERKFSLHCFCYKNKNYNHILLIKIGQPCSWCNFKRCKHKYTTRRN